MALPLALLRANRKRAANRRIIQDHLSIIQHIQANTDAILAKLSAI